ncbi:MAG: hypothetical protein K6G69_11495 [Lachnospiraceae bacterium]|nr:hypothetical protein [Lachnospiraceae bacterium]
MDVKAKIDEIVKKVQSDPKTMENFKKDPVKTVESLTGVDLPDDVVKQVVTGVKGKIKIDQASGILNSLKNLTK